VAQQALRLAVAVFVGLLCAPELGAEEAESKVVGEGRKVSIEYTLKLDDGSVADTNVGGQPLVYQHGTGQILPGLENSLAGLHANDSKQVVLPPEQGYGKVDPAAQQVVPIDKIPEDARKVGTQLVSQNPQGMRRFVRVQEVREKEIVLDLNHPLAGQTLHFDVRVLSIE
jgi:FKBP-type peptidyl-prolyl cis-trans isomerase 2